MKRLFSWLGFGSSYVAQPSMPQELLDLIPTGAARSCKFVLEKWIVAGGADENALICLLAQVKAMGWAEDEVEKLSIYGDFFAGRNDAAQRRIKERSYEQTDFDMFVAACISLYLLDRFEEAYMLLRQRQPDDAEFSAHPMFLSFAGYVVLAAGGPIQEAVRYFDIGLSCGLESIAFLTNAYGVYFEAGELEKIERLRRLVYSKQLGDPQVLFAVACVELARDYYPEGFRLAEARYDHPEVARHMKAELLQKPRWRGEDLSGSRLLVHGEQGLGDTVMCARYIPLLLDAGIEVVFDCQDAAVSLLEHNYPEVKVINRDTSAALTQAFDYWIGAMSLPYLMNSSARNIPLRAGYLTVSDEHRSHWQQRVAAVKVPGFRVGIAWSGNPHHRADRRRSIGLDPMFTYMQNSKGVCFFALQTSVPEFLPENTIDFSDEMMTLSDTAALIMEMDLVITVDTSIVHLAGALGKTAWLLFPHRYEWRWGLAGEDNNWYDSVRVIRQSAHGEWAPVLSDVFEKMLPEVVAGQHEEFQ